jgi:hypothetical protein
MVETRIFILVFDCFGKSNTTKCSHNKKFVQKSKNLAFLTIKSASRILSNYDPSLIMAYHFVGDIKGDQCKNFGNLGLKKWHVGHY